MYELTECELKKVAGGVGNQYFFTPVSIPDFFYQSIKNPLSDNPSHYVITPIWPVADQPAL